MIKGKLEKDVEGSGCATYFNVISAFEWRKSRKGETSVRVVDLKARFPSPVYDLTVTLFVREMASGLNK
jgi:hypothetical protein